MKARFHHFVVLLAGAALGLSSSLLLAWTIGRLWGPLYFSEADMSRNVELFLLGSCVAAIAGAWIALRVHARRLAAR